MIQTVNQFAQKPHPGSCPFCLRPLLREQETRAAEGSVAVSLPYAISFSSVVAHALVLQPLLYLEEHADVSMAVKEHAKERTFH